MTDRRERREPRTVPLAELAPGAMAVLQDISDLESRAVLQSLGLTSGARLRVCRIGDPCIVQVRSTRIGLSKHVAQSVQVRVDGGESW